MLGNVRFALGFLALVFAYLAGAASEGLRAREAGMPATPLLSSGETVVGERIAYPQGPAQVTAAVVALAPGAETGWHTHGVPVLGYMLEGELSVDYGSKGVRVYRAGDAFLESMRVPHNGRNSGQRPMRILAVFMGAEGAATSKPAKSPESP